MSDEDPHQGEHGEKYPVKAVFFVSASMVIAALLRHIRYAFYFLLMDKLALMTIGFCFRTFMKVEHMKSGELRHWKDPFSLMENTSNIYSFLSVMLPLHIIDSSFNAQVINIKSKWPHILFVIIPNFGLTFLVYFLIGKYLYPADFEWTHYLMVVSMILFQSFRIWKQFCSYHNVKIDVQNVIQVEQLVNIILGISFFHLAWLQQNDELFKVGSITSYLFSLVVGFMAAHTVSYWIGHIHRDHANITTIFMTCFYMNYLFCMMCSIPAPLSIYVMGLTLATKRDTMTQTFLLQFNKLHEVAHLMMSSTVSIESGMRLQDVMFGSDDDESHITKNDYIGAFMLFLIQQIIRLLTVFLVRILNYKKPHYIDTKLSCIIVSVSNFSGTLGMLFAFACFDIFKTNDRISHRIFFTVTINIFLSLAVNQHLSVALTLLQIKFSDMKEKSIQLERVARFLIETKVHSFVNLKNDTFLVDADWDVVAEYTMIKNDIMREYKNKQWLRNPSRKNSVLRKTFNINTINKNEKDEASKQIGKSEREIYRQMYEVGSINKRALLQLTHFADNIVRTSRLTKSEEIIRCTKLNKGRLWLYDCLRRSFVHLSHSRKRFFQYSFMGFVDLFFTICSIRTQLFDSSPPWTTIFEIHQITILILFTALLFFEVVFIERTIHISNYRIQTFITVFIVLAAIFDMVIYHVVVKTYDDKPYENIGNTFHHFLWFLLVVLRFLRLLKVVEVSQIMEKKLMSKVKGSIEKEILFACDMTRAFMKANRKTQKNISTFVRDPSVALHLRYIGHSQRLEIKQHQGLIAIKNLGVVTAYKTKLAVRNTLNSMLSKLDEIYSSGMINEADAETIRTSIDTRIFSTKKLATTLTPVSIENLVLNIPWVDHDLDLASFILTKGKVLIYSPYDVIVTQGHMPQGLFIILFGLVRIEQSINTDAFGYGKRKNVHKEVVYLCKNEAVRQHHPNFNETGEVLQGFLSRGSVIGEMSLLTDKPGHKTFICATHSEVLVVSYEDMARRVARAEPTSEMSVLERRMWYNIAIRQANTIMYRDTTTRGLLDNKLSNLLCNAHMIDGFTNKAVVINWSDTATAILIRGSAMNFFTNAQYVGPCLIPDYCPRLICQPELGMRVILLIMKKTEECQIEFPHYEEMVHVKDADAVSLSSGSSLGGPVIMMKNYYKNCQDVAVQLTGYEDARSAPSPKKMTSSLVEVDESAAVNKTK